MAGNMMYYLLYSLIFVFVLTQILINFYASTARSHSGGKLVKESPDVPIRRLKGQEDSRWLDLHEEYVAEARQSKEVSVVFFGDSLTLHWLNTRSWERLSKTFYVSNFGIGGDRTQHLLWRMENGELNFTHPPKVVVIMIGTNNIDTDSPEKIADGTFKAVERVRESLPTVKVILVGIPPRSKNIGNPIRVRTVNYNRVLEERATAMGIEFVRFPNLLQEDGTFSREYTTDFVHLTNKAYNALTDALIPKIGTLIAEAL